MGTPAPCLLGEARSAGGKGNHPQSQLDSESEGYRPCGWEGSRADCPCSGGSKDWPEGPGEQCMELCKASCAGDETGGCEARGSCQGNWASRAPRRLSLRSQALCSHFVSQHQGTRDGCARWYLFLKRCVFPLSECRIYLIFCLKFLKQLCFKGQQE